MNIRNFVLFLSILAAILTSCATPKPPTGGPGDTTGPRVLSTEPETGTINFDRRTFRFHFDEFIDRAGVRNALTVEPDFGIEYSISWDRKTMNINFEEELPDSTTILIKLGTEISDTHGNNLGRPVTLAVSTGSEIDSGTLQGKIRNANDGRSAEGQSVLLYRSPADFSKRANYYAQTDTAGEFEFSYLAEGRYKVIAADDRNRNKQWEREIEAAFPFNREFVELEKAGKDTMDVLYISRTDSIAPNLQGVGLFSQNRMRLRYSEDMKTGMDAEVIITDSLGNRYTTAYPLYVSPKEPFVIFAQTEEPLQENTDYRLNTAGFTDLAGNSVSTRDFAFTGTAQEDTTQQRIIRTNGEQGLLQKDDFRVTFAEPIEQPEILDSTVVIEGDVDFEDWPAMEVEQNTLLIKPQGEWIEGVEYQFLVWNPQSQRRTLFEPQVWDSTEYGEIELTLENTDTTATHIVHLYDEDQNLMASREMRNSGIIENLPPFTYTLVIFRDENDNRQWDKGTVVPYKAPEPYYVQRSLKVSEGFTSGVRISFE